MLRNKDTFPLIYYKQSEVIILIDINEVRGPNSITGRMNLIFRARMLWRDLATWMTIYLVSVHGNYDNQDAIRNKLYELPLEYGNFLKLVFGDVQTEEYINLLSTYIITSQNLFHAQMIGDANAVNEYARQLYQHIDRKAEFLARINPYWQEDTWQSLLYNFNNLLFEDSMTLLTGNYQKNIDVLDRLLSFSSVIGDYFSEGIIRYLRNDEENRPVPDNPAGPTESANVCLCRSNH